MKTVISAVASSLGLMSAASGMTAIAAAVAALTGLGAAIAMGIIACKAVESIARQPEADKKIRSAMLLGLAFAETTAIYGLLATILILSL